MAFPRGPRRDGRGGGGGGAREIRKFQLKILVLRVFLRVYSWIRQRLHTSVDLIISSW